MTSSGSGVGDPAAPGGASSCAREVAEPLVSVVIPAFGQAAYVGDAIRSVLDQTYGRFELAVVDDGSPDETADVVRGFADPRVQLIRHDRNRGLPAARNTGIRASSGELIALLDADDYYHPEKLAAHVTFLNGHPGVDVTYNPRFNLHHSSTAVRDVWRPPPETGLADFVLGWPFAPSDMVARRTPLFRAGLFDERYFSGGEDVDLPCRLALDGCRFASVDRVLNYRRYHAGRRMRNLPARWQDYQDALEAAFRDPRCPPDVALLRAKALASHCLEVAFLAFIQGQADLGREYTRETLRFVPGLTEGHPSPLLTYLVQASIADERRDHAEVLRRVFAELPPEGAGVAAHYDWAVRHGHLVKATRAVVWADDAGDVPPLTAEIAASGNDTYADWAEAQLGACELAFGVDAAERRARRLSAKLESAGAARVARRVCGRYWVNRAFRCHRAGHADLAVKAVAHAALADTASLANRGVLSVLLRSSARACAERLGRRSLDPLA